MIALLWLVGASVAAASGPLGLDEPRPSTATIAAITESQRLIDQGRGAEAVERLRREDAVNPGSADVLLNLGWAEWNLSRVSGAQRAWGLLYRCDPKNILFVRLYAAIEVEAGEPAHGEALAREALRLSPGDRESTLVLIKALAALDRLPEAQAVAEELAARFPRNTRVLYAAAQVYDLGRRYARSIFFYDRLVLLDPREPRFGRGRALALLELGRYEDAIAQWKALIDRQPPDEESLRQLARAYPVLQAYDEGWQSWLALGKRYSRSPSALVLVAAVQLERDRSEDALTSSKKILKLSPADPDGILLEARALMALEREGDARRALEEFVARHPDQVQTRFGAAELLAEMGFLPEALAQYDELLRRDPRNAAYRRPRAGVLFAMGRREEAVREWEALVAAAPPDLDSYSTMARAWASVGEFDAAAAAARRLIAADPRSPAARVLLAELELGRGEPAASERSARAALELAPGDRDATLALARAEQALERYDDARRTLSALMPRHRNFAPVRYALADLELADERPEAALPHLEQLLSLHPRNGLYHRRRGEALYGLGRFDEALGEWKPLARGRRPDLAAARLLGQDAMWRKEWGEAGRWFELAASTPTASGADHERLASAYLSGGRPGDALREADEALRRDPGLPGGEMLRADALEALGRYGEAEDVYARLERRNAANERAPLAVARLEAARGNPDAAIEELRKARKRLGWPQLQIKEARVLADAGRDAQALKEARRAAAGRGGGVSILAYSGLSLYDRGDGVPVKVLREHLLALKRAGYRPLTVRELAELVRRGDRLPPKAVVVTIEDPKARTLQAADQALKDAGWKATVFAPIGSQKPGEPSVDALRGLEASGRWDVESYGLQAPQAVAVDSSTHTGRFLISRAWRKDARRLETDAEFHQRVSAELDAARQAAAAFPGRADAALAFPGGDFGQQDAAADPAAAPFDSAAAADRFPIRLAHDPWGYDLEPKYDPRYGSTLRSLDVPRDWSGERLASYLSFNDPRLQARMLEGNVYLAEGRDYQALHLYEGLERDGVSAAELYAQKGVALEHIGYLYGAYQQYEVAARLDPDSERYQDLLRNAAMALGPHVAPEVSGLSDSAGRSHVKSLVHMGTSVQAALVEGWGGVSHFHETSVPGVEGREMGLRVRAPFNLWSGLDLSYGRRNLDLLSPASFGGVSRQAGRLRESDLFSGTLGATLVPGYRGELGLDTDDVDTASAILDAVRVQKLRAGLDWDMGLDWGADLGVERRRYSDGNAENAGRFALMRRMGNHWSVGYALTHSDARFRGVSYYAPLRLSEHMLEVSARPGTKQLRGLIEAGAGYGMQDTGNRFVQAFRTGLQGLTYQRFLWSLTLNYSHAPTYTSREVDASLSIGF